MVHGNTLKNQFAGGQLGAAEEDGDTKRKNKAEEDGPSRIQVGVSMR